VVRDITKGLDRMPDRFSWPMTCSPGCWAWSWQPKGSLACRPSSAMRSRRR